MNCCSPNDAQFNLFPVEQIKIANQTVAPQFNKLLSNFSSSTLGLFICSLWAMLITQQLRQMNSMYL